MPLSRRRFLSGLTVCLVDLPCDARAGETVSTGAGQPRIVGLRARPMAAPAENGSADATVLSYDGTMSGPVLRIVKGDELNVTLGNGLDVPTSLQWHGLRGPNAIDGDMPLMGGIVAPGANAAFRFTPPDSGFYWFHPAALPGQPDQTAAGLHGALIVDEMTPPTVDRDLLISIADGPAARGDGALVVNGQQGTQRVAMAPGARLRLRILNASTTQIMILAVAGARPLILAIDGQPSELFEPVRDSVPVGPGARFEFMIDMPREPGAVVRLLRRGTARGDGSPGLDTVLLEVTTMGVPRDPLPPIAALPRNPLLSPAIPLEQSVRADLLMEQVEAAAGEQPRWRLNGSADLALPKAPLLKVRMGGVVTLGLANRSGVPIALRVHGHVMRLLHGKDDGWEPYWRDSVLLPPNTVNHVAFLADNPGRWLIESALFPQAAFGLRSWFLVD